MGDAEGVERARSFALPLFLVPRVPEGGGDDEEDEEDEDDEEDEEDDVSDPEPDEDVEVDLDLREEVSPLVRERPGVLELSVAL